MSEHVNGASQHLLRQLTDSLGRPRLPQLTRHVMTALATGDEAAAAWRELGTDEATLDKVTNRVHSALEQALTEVKRPSVKDERTDIAHIIKLATNLKKEIKRTLPGDWCRVFQHELTADDRPPIDLEFGWHSLRPNGYQGGYPLAVSDVLDWAIQMAKEHAKNLPIRAVTRRGGRPEIQAFVRHLAWQFSREFGKEMRGTIAHIANAIFNPADPLDVNAVEGIVKDRPGPFKAPT